MTTDAPERTVTEVQHVTFQVNMPNGLEFVLNDWERGGWALLRVVPYTPYQAVAVFERRYVDAE